MPEATAQKLFELPPQLLFSRLPGVPTEHLVKETTPLPPSDLSPPVATQLTSTLVQYVVPETRRNYWAKLVGSPVPIDKILGRFATNLKNVTIKVEDIAEKPEGLPSLESGQFVSNYFRTTLDNADSNDLIVSHFTFFIDKTWVKENNIHKWSILLHRFDEQLGRWVSISTKRVNETADRIYYTAGVPDLALFAITGSTDLPGPSANVSDLKLDPTVADFNKPVTIKATVTNITSKDQDYTASLWIDDQLDQSYLVTVPSNGKKEISFDVISSVGDHSVRINRLFDRYTVQFILLNGDLNADAIVDLNDLAILAANLGKKVSTADINLDGIVDLKDLALLGLAFGPRAVTIGDANGNGLVNLDDLAILGSSFGSGAGTPEYVPGADFNNDGVVDLKDLAILAANLRP